MLVRTDLKRSSSAVQAGHAVAQFLIEHPDCDWNNGYLIYLKVRSLEQLENWKSKMDKEENIIMSYFSEPDLNNELTAIAVHGVDANLFKRLRLL